MAENNEGHLVSLPAEMLSAIAAQAESHHLLALRSSCRKLCAATEDHFISAFFTKRSHTFTRSALEALVNITAEPRLVKKLKEVELVAVKFVSLSPKIIRPEDTQDLLEDSVSDKEKTNNDLAIHKRCALVCKEKLDSEINQGLGYGWILRMFDNLVAARVVPAISAYGRDGHRAENTYGMLQLERDQLVYKYALDCKSSLSSDILSAIVVSDFAATSLTLGPGSGVCEVEIGMHSMIKAIVNKAFATASFRDLHSLALNFWPAFTRSPNPCLSALFKGSASLTRLTISNGHYGATDADDAHAFTILGKPMCRVSQLTSLNIEHSEAKSRHLQQFLGSFKSTLKTLKLRNIGLLGDNVCWGAVCKWLAEDFNLEQLEMAGLSKDDGLLGFEAGSWATDVEIGPNGELGGFRCVLEGAGQVKVGLRSLAEAPSYVYLYSSDEEDNDDDEDENED